VMNASKVLGALQFNLTFDPKVIAVENVSLGEAVENPVFAFNIQHGRVSVAITTLQGIRNGTVIMLRVKGVQEGVSVMHLTLTDATDLNANHVDGYVIDGQVKVVKRRRGDINNDNRLTVADALLYLRYSVGLSIAPYEIDPNLDDLNGDRRITVADALKVLRAAVGLEKLD